MKNNESTEDQRATGKREPDMARKPVVPLERAGDNAGVEDTPSNAPEEREAQDRLRQPPGGRRDP